MDVYRLDDMVKGWFVGDFEPTALGTMNGRVFAAGDIVVVKPGEATDFEALTDTTTTVVKLPSAKGDKYLVGE